MLSELRKLKERTIKELENLKDESLTGRWEVMFISKIDSEKQVFMVFQLDESRRRN